MIFSVTSLTDSSALTSTAFVRTLPRRLRFHGVHPGLALWRKLPIRITKRSCSLLKQPPWPIIRHLPDRTATVSWWTTTFSLMSLSSAPKISIPSKGSMTQIHWISACVREQVPSTEVCRCPPLQRVSTAVLRTSAHWNTTHRCRTTAPVHSQRWRETLPQQCRRAKSGITERWQALPILLILRRSTTTSPGLYRVRQGRTSMRKNTDCTSDDPAHALRTTAGARQRGAAGAAEQ